MRVAMATAPGILALTERPVPKPRRGHVLVKVRLCGVCGSDVAAVKGSARFPYSPGHEYCGIVETASGQVGVELQGRRVVIDPNLACGRCRYCIRRRPNLCLRLKSRAVKTNGGFADHVALDRRMVHTVPSVVPDDAATLVEPLSCAIHAVDVGRPQRGEKVLVLGGGTLGFLVALVLCDRGLRPVLVEPDDGRRARAKKLLRVRTLTPEGLKDRGPARFDLAVEASGGSGAATGAVEALARGGRLVLAGLVKGDVAPFPLANVTRNELEVRGAWLNPGTFPRALRLATRHRRLLARLPAERFPLSEVAAGFARAAEPGVPRILVHP